MLQAYYNPYSGATFCTFFSTLFSRLWLLLMGQLPLAQLATDEVQLLVLGAVALSSAWVGTFLVLRRMTMLANALSHTILLGIVLAFLFLGRNALQDAHGHLSLNVQVMLLASVAMGILTTFSTEFLSGVVGLQKDASTGIVFTSLFALGIVLVTSFTRNAHIGTEVVMGNADALHVEDVRLVGWVLMGNLLLFLLFYKEYKITTFDPALAQALGISAVAFNYLLMVQVALTAVAAFRAVGVLMVLAFLTGPTIAARMMTHRLGALLVTASLLGVVSALGGVALSRHILSSTGVPLSTGGLTVCVLVIVVLATALWSVVERSRHRRKVTRTSTEKNHAIK